MLSSPLRLESMKQSMLKICVEASAIGALEENIVFISSGHSKLNVETSNIS